MMSQKTRAVGASREGFTQRRGVFAVENVDAALPCMASQPQEMPFVSASPQLYGMK